MWSVCYCQYINIRSQELSMFWNVCCVVLDSIEVEGGQQFCLDLFAGTLEM